MRLIDADKLKTQFPEPADWLDINQTLVHKTGIWAEIDVAETVEAIPVDWIEAEIKKLRDMDNGFASLSAGQIGAMLKRWREEQQAPACGPDYCEIGGEHND